MSGNGVPNTQLDRFDPSQSNRLGLSNTTQSTNIDQSKSYYAPSSSPIDEKEDRPADAPQASSAPAPAAVAVQAAPAQPDNAAAKVAAGGKIPWTPVTLASWFALGIIRGTTITMLGLAGDDISPTIIVILRSPGTIVLFVLTIAIWSARNPAIKANMKESLTTPMTYLKLTILGITQSGGPLLLFTYGVIYVPPSFGGAFLALVPVFTVLVDQTIFRALGFKTGKVNGLKIAGMIVVALGVAIFVIPSFLFQYSDDIEHQCQLAGNGSNATTLTANERKRLCATNTQIIINLVELLFGSMLFGFAGVYWRNAKGKIHFTLSGCGQTVVGGILAVIFWGTLLDGKFEATYTPASISAVVYLMVLSGYGAATMVFFLYGKIGAVPTARVMCIVPVVAWIEDRIIFSNRGSHGLGLEAFGLIMLTAGLILFEGRVDQICGFNVPCVQYHHKRKEMNRFSTSLMGDAEVRARGLSTKLLEDDFEGVEVDEEDELNVLHTDMAKYSSSVGEFELVF